MKQITVVWCAHCNAPLMAAGIDDARLVTIKDHVFVECGWAHAHRACLECEEPLRQKLESQRVAQDIQRAFDGR